jgi:hypothetical protein
MLSAIPFCALVVFPFFACLHSGFDILILILKPPSRFLVFSTPTIADNQANSKSPYYILKNIHLTTPSSRPCIIVSGFQFKVFSTAAEVSVKSKNDNKD